MLLLGISLPVLFPAVGSLLLGWATLASGMTLPRCVCSFVNVQASLRETFMAAKVNRTADPCLIDHMLRHTGFGDVKSWVCDGLACRVVLSGSGTQGTFPYILDL